MYQQNSPTSTEPSNRKSNKSSTSLFSVRFLRLSGVCTLLFTSLFLLQACNDDNFVGSSFVDDERKVVIDTVFADSFEVVDLKSFTGNLTFFMAGYYDDPLFGVLESTAYLAPGLISQSNEISDDAEFYLRLIGREFYGNLDAQADFELEFIDERWRSSLMNVDTVLDTSPPAEPISFFMSVQNDSIDIRLPDEWVEKYLDIFNSEERNERLLEEEFGFALKPLPSDLLIGFRTGALGARIIARQDAETDDDEDENGVDEFTIPLRSRAYNLLNDEPAGLRDETLPVYNTFKNALKLNVDLSQFSDKSITRVEIVMYEDTLALQQNFPGTHSRLTSNRLNYFQLSDAQLNNPVITPAAFTPDNTIHDDLSYRVSMTETIKRIMLGATLDGDFYILSGSNNGLFNPTALNLPGHPERAPKFIITYVNPEVN